MYRNVINDFAIWYEEPKRKILHVKGAYGVGKTWSVKDFATAFFGTQIYIDLNERTEYTDIFLDDVDYEQKVAKIDELIEEQYGEFDVNDTLLIFDNLPDSSLCDEFFYNFAKKHRHYIICLISNSMKITEFEYGHPDVFRVIRMRPMSFEEYLIANKALPLISAVQNNKAKELNPFEIDSINRFLKEYLFIGGMPEIVNAFLKSKDYSIIRPMQENILDSYDKLIKKSMSEALATRCRRIWRSIPKQLTQDNKKFMYRYVEDNARAREYSDATQILCDMGLIRKMPKLTKGEIPLEDYVDYKSFQLFLLDHGLLRAIYKNPIDEAINLEDILNENNLAVAEQFIFQELSNKVGPIYYWNSGATARVPFVYEGDGAPIPVDIRFVNNNKAQNMKTFIQKNPEVTLSVKISFEQVSLNNNVLNIPVYGLWNM